jgi:hypothetical protein
MSASSTYTLASIRLSAQRKADMENSNFISQDEWNDNITRSYKELYDLLVSAYGNDYFVSPTPFTITADGVSQTFDLPTDFYKLVGVDVALDNSNNSYVTLKPFMFAERNKYSLPYLRNSMGRTSLRYRLINTKIMFNQIPQAGLQARLWYVPEPTNLSLDTDTLDGISGWEEYVIIDAAVKALQKEESDTSDLRASKMEMKARLVEMAENRDAGMSAQVVDIYAQDDPYAEGDFY